jgi:Tol biopolymer transport system component/exonuclease VII small subunit
MKKATFVIAVIVLMSISLGSAQQEGLQLFQKALAMERGEGNLEEAIALYQKVTQAAKDEALAAKAQLRIGICYEKLGMTEAQKAYQLVIEKYPSQTEQVVEARSRMAVLAAEKPLEPSLVHLWSNDEDGFYFEAQSLSPDGSKLLGVNFTKGQNVVYKDLSTGKLVNITSYDWYNADDGFTYNPVWSPDGRGVAFNFRGNKDKTWELRVGDLAGKIRTVYRCEREGENKIDPCGWFPKGDAILAVHITQDNVVQLGVVSLKGGDFELIHEPGVPTDVHFQPDATRFFLAALSPDGKRIAFDLAEGDVKRLYIMDIASKRITQLSDTPASDFQPLWSPDGRRLAFLSDRPGSRALWAIPVGKDGKPSGPPRLVRDSMDHAQLGSWTPRGIFYTNWVSMNDIYTLAVDPKTGAPTGRPQQLDFRPPGYNGKPVYSPDGRFLAFAMKPDVEPPSRSIVVYPFSGGEAKIFRIPSKNHWVALSDLNWIPDGSGISFRAETSSETPGYEAGAPPYRLFKLDLGGAEWQTWDIGGTPRNISEWRGDSEAIFYTGAALNGRRAIIERNIQTGEERVLTDEAGGIMSCSRDYSRMAFSRAKKLRIIDTTTGEILKEFADLEISGRASLSWSPKGDYLLGLGGGRTYGVLSITDGAIQEYDLSEFLPEGTVMGFDWSPDGDQLAFSFEFGQFNSYLITSINLEDEK